MATGDVTISTFLELKDNLSGGIKSVESQINRLTDAAKQAEDAIKRMKTAQAARPPKPPAPPPPPGGRGGRGGAGGAGKDDPFLKFSSGVFSSVVRANLLVDAIEGAVSGSIKALGQLLSYSVKVGEEYENTNLRIASTLTGMQLAPSMEAASVKSKEIIGTLRDLAVKLPGEAKDYYGVFTQGLPNAIASGMTDVMKYADFAARYTATMFGRVDAPQAGRDLTLMLQGRAMSTVKSFMELQPYLKMTAKEFNKLAPEKRMQMLQEAVSKAGVGMVMAGETANAKFGELKSRIEEIFIIGGQPFFEAVKGSVTDINALLAENKETVTSLVKIVSTELGNAVRGVAYEWGNLAAKAAETSNEYLKIRETAKMMQGKKLSGDPLEATMQYYEQVGAARMKKEADDRVRKQIEFQESVVKKYPQLAGRVPEMGAWAPGTEEYAKAQTDLRESLKALWSPPKGMQRIFDTSQEWQAFAESRGLSTKDAQALWEEMIREGKVSLPTAPTTAREINVNFNNNRFDIRQAFAEGFDPDRIAVAFASDLGRLGEMQMQSSLAPYASHH